jgi:hypothetical protein
MTTFERAAQEHVADLLPEYLNGALDPAWQAIVTAHLEQCDGCRESFAAWDAIARATRSASLVTAPVTVSAAHVSIIDPISLKENEVTSIAVTLPDALPKLGAIYGPVLARRIGRVVGPVTRIAAVLLIAAGLVSGIRLMSNDSGNGGGIWGFAALQNDGDECTANPPTDERLASALDISSVLTGSSTNLASWLIPDVRMEQPRTLPEGTPVEEAGLHEVQAVWTEFVVCAAENDASEFGLVTDDGLRRAFYQNAYDFAGATLQDDQSNVKSADAVEPPAPANDSAVAETTENAATSENKEAPASDVALVNAKTADFVGLEITDAAALTDGRIVVALDDPAIENPVEFAGIVVFANVDGAWLIDDYYRIYG